MKLQLVSPRQQKREVPFIISLSFAMLSILMIRRNDDALPELDACTE